MDESFTPGIDLASGAYRVRTLAAADAPLAAEATRREKGRALWGPRPVGPYSLAQARAALDAWDPARSRQGSYGLFESGRLVAAVGVMLDDAGAELAYWVRPEQRRRGLAVRALRAVTGELRRQMNPLPRLWLEIDPGNSASQAVAQRAGYVLEGRLRDHCRSWVSEDPAQDRWHDCLIWVAPAGEVSGVSCR